MRQKTIAPQEHQEAHSSVRKLSATWTARCDITAAHYYYRHLRESKPGEAISPRNMAKEGSVQVKAMPITVNLFRPLLDLLTSVLFIYTSDFQLNRVIIKK